MLNDQVSDICSIELCPQLIKELPQQGIEPRTIRCQDMTPTTDLSRLNKGMSSNCHICTFFWMNSAIKAASWPYSLAEVTFVDLWPLLLENSGPTAHYFQWNSYLKLLWLFSSLSEEKFYFTEWSKILPHWVKKKVIFWFCKFFL